MASFRKNSKGRWEAQISRQGVRKGKTFSSKVEAVRWATEAELEILGGRKLTEGKTFGDLLQKYRSEFTQNKGSAYTEDRMIDRMLGNDIANVKLKDLSPFHFAEWRNARLKEVSGSTVARNMAVMSAAINVAVKEWGWLEANPIKDVTKPKPNPARDRRISEDEITQILQAAGYHPDKKPETIAARVGAAFLFAIETGMRDGELATLTIDRVNFERRVAHIKAENSKTRVKRDVPLSREAIRIIKQMGAGEGVIFGLTSVQISKAFIRIKAACGIGGLTFHDTRHEAVTRLSRKLDPLELARVVGHKNLNQLMTYYSKSVSDIATKL